MKSVLEVTAGLLIIAFIYYWRFFGIEALDKPISDFYINYPLWVGVICLILGPLFFYSNYKDQQKESTTYGAFLCARSALFIPAGIYLIFKGI